jgi:hypothetical protein
VIDYKVVWTFDKAKKEITSTGRPFFLFWGRYNSFMNRKHQYCTDLKQNKTNDLLNIALHKTKKTSPTKQKQILVISAPILKNIMQR